MLSIACPFRARSIDAARPESAVGESRYHPHSVAIVSIDIAVPCVDPNFADYQAILAQTATERVVVDTVSGEVVSEMLDSWAIPDEPDDDWDGPDWPSWDDCISQCEDDDGLPSWCDGWSWDHPEMDCQDKETCCVNAAYLHRCRRRCTCDYLGHPNKQEDCYETAELALDMMKGECKKKFDECDKQCE